MNQTQTRSLRKRVLSLILAVVMAVSLLPISAFASGDSKASTTDNTDYYKILHLDCGRKYFSKDWIIALLNEMKADGYNQLQLAFGNDGLRFLLDDMSFTANGTTYSHETVKSKVEAGNKLQNSSGDASWLTQTEMDEIIAAAKEKGIEIVPLLNLPGHANAILDIADNNTYNAKIYGTVSQNTLDVTNDAACNFGYEIFKKYVDYFSSKGCKYFNFGADEYGNDTGDKNPHFDVLKGTGYENLSTFINKLAAYIGSKNMTPRTFNDALYYNGWDMKTSTNTAIKTIQCCYWSCGWGSSYPVASAETIASKHHDMINTNGDYYYVLGKADKFDGDYSYASNFSNAGFMGSTVNSPVGSMFCIWSDFPTAETEQVVAQKVRLPMRAMALRMDDKSIDSMGTGVIQNGFNADGTLNVGSTGGAETDGTPITVAVNGTWTVTVNGNNYAGDDYKTADETIASVVVTGQDATEGVPTYDTGTSVTYSALANNNTEWTKTDYFYKVGSNYYPVYAKCVTEYWTTYYYGYKTSSEAEVTEVAHSWREYTTATVYKQTGKTEGTSASTTINFTGHKVGDTTVVIGGVTYKIHVTAEDLSKVTPLTIEYWITNRQVTANGGTNKEINAADSTINSETGAKFTDLGLQAVSAVSRMLKLCSGRAPS